MCLGFSSFFLPPATTASPSRYTLGFLTCTFVLRGQKKTAVRTTTSTRVVAAGTAALEAKVAELTLTLEISQKGTDTILERAVAAEAEVKDLLASIEKGSAGSKTTESPAKMPESSAILQLKVSKVSRRPHNPPSSFGMRFCSGWGIHVI